MFNKYTYIQDIAIVENFVFWPNGALLAFSPPNLKSVARPLKSILIAWAWAGKYGYTVSQIC